MRRIDMNLCEYIWMDGATPTKKLRSKSRVVCLDKKLEDIKLEDFPEWGFDGSSTYQAPGKHSDLILKPVCFVRDPLRGKKHFLVMCEVLTPDGTPHATNTRAKLHEVLSAGAAKEEPWFGVEQEYTLV